MFRLSQFIREIDHPTPVGPRREPPGPVVVWNLLRRCNLLCKHCYSASADKAFPGELSTEQIFAVMDDLRAYRVPVLILSGGEPLLHPDIFDISSRAKGMGFYTALSSNGTLITSDNIERIAAVGYDYVGVSIDGVGDINDRFRGKAGAYAEAIRGVALCRDAGIKVGLRFTMTEDNAHHFEGMIDLLEAEGIDKFYLSHLNYAGRGNANRRDDAVFRHTRQAMEMLFERALSAQRAGRPKEFVTGNNDADGVFLLHWVQKRFPERAEHIRAKLENWGGNATGRNVANIDNIGNVHPDTMWSHHTLGNVKTRPFSEVWEDVSDPIMAGLKAAPRVIGGRCGRCVHFAICNGNTRTRAERLTGDPWAEDPGCYLSDEEIGLSEPAMA